MITKGDSNEQKFTGRPGFTGHERATVVDGNSVTYHWTTVFQVDGNQVTLNTGGFGTATTKRRMNQAAWHFDLDFSVYSKKGVWKVSVGGQEEPLEFSGDTLVFKCERTGRL